MYRDTPRSRGLPFHGGFGYKSTRNANGACQFVVGIDFGTTVHRPPQRHPSATFRDLPGTRRWYNTGRALSVDEAKAPTKIAALDRASWGFEVSDTDLSFKWFKLALPHDDELQDDLANSAELDEARTLRREHEVKTSELVEAYMGKLWHQYYDVRRHRRSCQLGGFGTQASLLTAARAAGIPGGHDGSKVETCAEPEAAALGLLMKDKENIEKVVELRDNDIFTVLDTGGGTSDAITFKMRSKTPMIVDQYVAADARFCGPVQIEKLIFDNLFQKVKRVADPDRFATLTPADIQPLFHNLWNDKIRKHFNGFPPRPDQSTVEVPVELLHSWTRGPRSPAKDELKGLMDPTINKIIALVRSQFTAALDKKDGRSPKALLVCGGFSQNPYLRARLDEYIREWNTAGRQVGVYFTNKQLSMTAVAEGCALRAIELRFRHTDTQSELLARIASRLALHDYSVLPEGVINRRVLMPEGHSVSATESELFELRLTDLWWAFPESEGFNPDYWKATCATSHIYAGTCEVCEMEWSGAGIQRLVGAFLERSLVQLGIGLTRCNGIYFTAHINGVKETQGESFTIEPTMRRAQMQPR
ncbi:hypothetical protein F5144DRAFT_550940 [Chaetomium tenue]|uniref:Uncharacterized protein n=1 Tax=Chaetomium tenue TaxID=1854479 RepID=A0ACB7P272_9PEZI|nr:hypothetical protein F5144DRAFT_550940 [Chaetomium globosum]